jgi:hypothetical protein
MFAMTSKNAYFPPAASLYFVYNIWVVFIASIGDTGHAGEQYLALLREVVVPRETTIQGDP